MKPDVRVIEVPWVVPPGIRHRFVLVGSGGARMELSMARPNAISVEITGDFHGVEGSLSLDWLEHVMAQLRGGAV